TREKEPKQNDQNNNINNINNYTTPCNKPTINVAQNSVISNTENFTISFTTTNISDKSTIMVKDATGLTVPYNFNTSTNTVSSGVVLKPGVNRFTLYVQNECGSASQNIEINFSDCQLPVINFSGLFQDGSSTTRQSTINLSAIIQNVEASGIMLYVNGFPRSQFTYNALNDALLSTISLNPGINTIKIEASNPCGQTYVSSEVVYDNCITPALAMVSPSTNGTSVSAAAQTITVSTSGFNGKNEFSVLLNGQNVPAFTWSNSTLTIPVTLVAGMNTITVNGTNRCGSESVVITLNYLQCQTPVITLQNPSTTSVAVSKAAYTVKFKTQNQTSTSLMVNNLLVRNYTYNAATGLLEYTFNLTPGSNIVTLTSSNSCGVDIETINITYNNCTTPSTSVTSSGGTWLFLSRSRRD
ncbi:MAG: hypothetical protein EB023_02495, partial [Flavobacteriia bacterium]|nr:hypothetical protein [Flavobacteriia bacterium]